MDSDDLFETLTAITAVATLPFMILGFIFLGWQVGVAIMAVGWFLLVPVFAILSDRTELNTAEADEWLDVTEHADDLGKHASESDDPLQTLRERYARGELDDDEFERALETLLETDEFDPEKFLERRRAEQEGEPELER